MKAILIENNIKAMGKKNKSKRGRLEESSLTSEDISNENQDPSLNQRISEFTTNIRKKCTTPVVDKFETNSISKSDNDIIISELKTADSDKTKRKKKKKSTSTTSDKSNIQCKLKGNGDEKNLDDDQADSIDSGCVLDTADIKPSIDIVENLLSEYNFVKQLTCHAPSFVDTSIESSDDDDGQPGLGSNANNPIENSSKTSDSKSQSTDPADNQTTLKENRARLEGMLRSLKAGKMRSIPANRVKSTIVKLRKKLQILAKEERKEKIRAANRDKMNEAVSNVRNVYNQSGNLVFNKFDFVGGKEVWVDGKPNDLKKIMSKVIQEKEKIKAMTQNKRINDAATRLENNLWQNAMNKVEGKKVKDNPMKLARSIKRIEHKKGKSHKKWSKHQQMTEQLIKQKLDKRTQNIQKRRQQKLERKMNKGKKSKSKNKGSKQKGKNPGF